MDSERAIQLEKELDALAKQMSKTPKRLKFAEFLAQGDPEYIAYQKAGYKSKNPTSDASKAVKQYPVISQYKFTFQELARLQSIPEQLGTFEQKRQMLWQALTRCMEEVELIDGDEDQPGEQVRFKFDSRGVAILMSELNKMDGDHAAIKTKNTHFVGDFSEMTDDELDREIATAEQGLGSSG